MKRALGFLAASALGFSCFAAPAKIATQDWVKNALAAAGVRVSTAVVQTNITTSATGAVVTNLTFSSSYTCPEVPQCRAISFTVSTAKTSYRQAMTPKTRSLLNLLFASVYADGEMGTAIDMLINSGYWVDAGGNKHNFVFDGGWLVELNDYELPPMPSGTHACTLGRDCVCEVANKSQEDKMKDPEYQRYKDATGSEFWEEFGTMENWIDLSAWGSESWQKVQTLPNGKAVYSIQDDQGLWFNLENLWKSDALAEAMSTTVVEYNKYMKECREAYLRINTCDKKSPQHLWVAHSCGSSSWEICGNNPAHTRGTESHVYAGGQGDAASHPCVCGATSQPHQWGNWACDGYSGEYATLVRICPVAGCGASALAKVPLSAIKECVAEIGLHVPKGNGCGCKCGKGENLDSGAFHFWDGSDIVRGVTNCLCVCGAKHVFREPTTYWKNQHQDEWCEGVCQSCRRRLKDGRPAAESDHTPKPRSKRRCGCRCGWFGVDQEHTDGGREAKTQRMHPQCMVNNTGDPSSPPYCKCFGTGNGGAWHYHEPFPDSSCPAVCQYMATEDSSLGHLAAGEPSPTSGGTRPATAAHHRGKAYGCGCRCGRCGENNRPDWKGNDALHRPAQNAADQCHCSCESRRLVGSGKGGHEFSGTSCTCTCGGAHRSSLNACGLCLGGDGSTPCGRIHRYGELLEDTADNHRFDSDSCTCRCGSQTRDHDWGAEWRGDPTTTYCPRCGATLDRYPMWRTCKRCGLQEDTGRFEYSGTHQDGCTETGGDETSPPAVDKCGECGHIAPGHYPSCSQYASGDQGETDDTGSIGEI